MISNAQKHLLSTLEYFKNNYLVQVKIIATFIAFSLVPFILLAQFDFGLTAAKTEALGGVQSVQQHAFSAIENQAGLAALKSISVGVTAQNQYLLEGLNNFGLAAALPTSSGTFGVGIQYQGLKTYTEMKAGIAYGRQLLDNLSIGAQIHAYHLNITNYGSKTLVNFDLGIQAELTKQLLIGAHIKNPIKMNVTQDEQLPIPASITVGLQYSASNKAKVMMEAEKTVNRTVLFKAGLAYQFNEAFELLLGVTTDPAVFSMGISWQLQSLEIVLGSTYHTVLGYSPVLSIGFAPKASNSDKQILNSNN